jgi:hypothetical protein
VLDLLCHFHPVWSADPPPVRIQALANSKVVKSLAVLTAILITGIFSWQMFMSLAFFNTINDLPEYYVAAQLALQGKGSLIYKAQEFYNWQDKFFPGGGHGVLLFIPPPGVMWLLILAAIPAGSAPVVWTVFLELVLMAAIILLIRLFRLNFLNSLVLWCFTFFSGAAVDAVRIGQIAPLLLLAFTFLLMGLSEGSAVAAGIALSFFMCKPQQIIPFAIYLLGNKQFKPIAIAASVALALTVGSIFLMGVESYQNYLQLIADPNSIKIMQPELNPTIKGQLAKFLGANNIIVKLISEICFVLSSLLIFLLARKQNGKDGWLKIGLIGAVPLGLVSSIHCHHYDLLLLIPSIILSLQISKEDSIQIPQTTLIKILAVAIVACFLFPVYMPMRYDYLMKGGTFDPTFFLLASYAVTTFICCWRAHPKQSLDLQEGS